MPVKLPGISITDKKSAIQRPGNVRYSGHVVNNDDWTTLDHLNTQEILKKTPIFYIFKYLKKYLSQPHTSNAKKRVSCMIGCYEN